MRRWSRPHSDLPGVGRGSQWPAVGSYYLPVLPYSEAAYLAAVGAGLGVLHDLNLAARGLAQLGDLGARLLRVRVRVKARVRVRVRVRANPSPSPSHNPNPNQLDELG